jgi:hypothetical protein
MYSGKAKALHSIRTCQTGRKNESRYLSRTGVQGPLHAFDGPGFLVASLPCSIREIDQSGYQTKK